MLEPDFDLRDFANVTRLFPLPGVVMFPHVVLPLHIFEPRYRQMTEHALASDRLITIVQISPATKGQTWTEPVPIESVGCLGKIIQYERLPEGRFNFLLLGLKRVRLLEEIPTKNLYRSARVEILEDEPPSISPQQTRSELVQLFREVFTTRQELDPEFADLMDKEIPLGVLTDLVAHALSLPSELKQWLLGQTSVDQRCQTILAVLRQVAQSEQSRKPFPPPFSVN
jgi:Lon protease-like protein